MANNLYNCPYDKHVACDMNDGCNGCEEFARYIKEAAPSASTNTGSPKLSLDAMEMVLSTGGDCSDDLWEHAQTEFQAVKDFIAAQLRAGA